MGLVLKVFGIRLSAVVGKGSQTVFRQLSDSLSA